MIISFDTGKISATGGGTGLLQQKKVNITKNGLDVVIPDAGYDGLSTVYLQTDVLQDTNLESVVVNVVENGTLTVVPEDGTAYNEVVIVSDVIDTTAIDEYLANKDNYAYFDIDEFGINRTTKIVDNSRFIIDGGQWNNWRYDNDTGEYTEMKNMNGEDYITPFIDLQTYDFLKNEGVKILDYEHKTFSNKPITSWQGFGYTDFYGNYKEIYTTFDGAFLYKVDIGYEDYYLSNPLTSNSYNYGYLPLMNGGYVILQDTQADYINLYSSIDWAKYLGGNMQIPVSPTTWIYSVGETNGALHITPNEFSDIYPIYLPFLLFGNEVPAEEVVWVFDNSIDRADVYYKDIKRIKGLKLTNKKNCSRICMGCSTLRNIESIEWAEVSNLKGMFYGCKRLVSIPNTANIITTGLTSLLSTFYECNSLTSLDMTGWDLSRVTDFAYAFYGCRQLQDLKFGVNAKGSYSFNMSNMPLTNESLLSVLNGLFDFIGNGETPTSSQAKLALGTTNLAKLTDEQIAIATDKGWTLVG